MQGGVATPASIATTNEMQRMVRFVDREDTTVFAPVRTPFRVADDELKKSVGHRAFSDTL